MTSTASLVFENSALGTINNGRIVADRGEYVFVDVLVRMKPNSTAILNLKVKALTTYNNKIPFIDSPLKIYIYARPCQAGEMYKEEYKYVTCKKCE